MFKIFFNIFIMSLIFPVLSVFSLFSVSSPSRHRDELPAPRHCRLLPGSGLESAESPPAAGMGRWGRAAPSLTGASHKAGLNLGLAIVAVKTGVKLGNGRAGRA